MTEINRIQKRKAREKPCPAPFNQLDAWAKEECEERAVTKLDDSDWEGSAEGEAGRSEGSELAWAGWPAERGGL
jgi:hypothetical protein